MNIFLQVGLGLIPAVIVLILLVMKRKVFQFKTIFKVFLFIVVVAGVLSYGIRNFGSTLKSENMLAKNEMIYFANALVMEGVTEEAWEVIDEYSSWYGYDEECSMLAARLYALSGDYERANGIYEGISEEKYYAKMIEQEYELLSKKIMYNSSYIGMMNYITASGKIPSNYGYTENSVNVKNNLAITDEMISKQVQEAIRTKYKNIADSKIQKCAQYIAEIDGIYNMYISGDTTDDSEINKVLKNMNEMQKDFPDIYSQRCMRIAKLKINVLAGEFDEITTGISSASLYDELMVASELYMSGMTSKRAYPLEYHTIDSSTADLLSQKLDNIYKRCSKNLTIQQKKTLKSRINSIQREVEEPILSTIKNQLIEKTYVKAGTDRSKVYFQLAKIENYYNNDVLTEDCLRQAIYDSQDCKDNYYTEPMSELIAVINNDSKDELENIKNVADYVDAVIDHSMVVDVSKIISGGNKSDIVDNEDNNTTEDFEQQKELLKNFSQTITDYVSKVRSAICIGKINTDNFETIDARVQIASGYNNDIEMLKNQLSIYDCGVNITDYDIQKIEFSGSNILLCCDVSGSMDAGIEDLRNAVKTFVQEKNENENISVVTFNDSIVETKNFGSSDDELVQLADSMTADGGTDMFSALVTSLKNFRINNNANNVIILMTDGQDNNPKETETIYQEIGQLAIQKGITVYTLGLGEDVDTAYLTTIADSSNGDFVYVSDSSSLNTFYEMLHGQVSDQYELTYIAKDTMTMSSRTLEVALTDEKVRDLKTYSIGSASSEQSPNGTVSATQDLTVAGLNIKYMYKGTANVEALLLGTGFEQNYAASLKLNGNLDYDIELKFVDKNTYSLVIPASIAVGTYNIEVTIDNKHLVFEKEFSVLVQGDEQKTAFGPYVFTSTEKIENGEDGCVLRGAVCMNGWLHFKGDVLISGDMSKSSFIEVTDDSGSYVQFDRATAEGFGKIMAERDIPLNLPSLGKFKLYNDFDNIYDYSEYMVDDIQPGVLKVFQVVQFDTPTIRLYPNQIELNYQRATTILPYQDVIFEKYGIEEQLFNFELEGSGIISDRNIGVVAELGYDDNGAEQYRKINMFNSPIYLNVNELKLKIDTIDNEYMIGGMVKIAFLDAGVGAEFEWKGLDLDSVILCVDKDINNMIGPVPVTYSGFKAGAKNIQEAVKNREFKKIKISAAVTIATGKVKAYMPELEKFVGDVSLFEMPETTIEFSLSPISADAEATLNFLKEITIAEASVHFGTFDYKNTMLGLDTTEVVGFNAQLKRGFVWDIPNCSVEATGTGEIDAHSRFMGMLYTGMEKINIKWWWFNMEYKEEGKLILGLHTTHANQLEFVLGCKGIDKKGKIRGGVYYIDFTGQTGEINGTLS